MQNATAAAAATEIAAQQLCNFATAATAAAAVGATSENLKKIIKSLARQC